MATVDRLFTIANFLRRKAQKFGPSTIRITFVLRKFSENVGIANYVKILCQSLCQSMCDSMKVNTR